jgi:hypothetical protein
MTTRSTANVHALTLALLGGILVLWAAGLVATLAAAGASDQRSGALIAVFPRGTGESEVLARVARAEGAIVRGSWFANVWHVHGEQPNFARTLREQGALWVLPTLSLELLGAGGCGFGADLPARDPGTAPPVSAI